MSEQPKPEQPKSAPPNDSELTGIGGWLFLVAWGQLLGLAKFFVTLVQYYASLEIDLMQKFPLTFAGEAALNVAVGALYVTTAVLFFRKSRRFPRFFVYEIIAAAALLPVSVGWIALGMSLESDQSGWAIALSTVQPYEIVLTIAGAIVGGLWIVYLNKSRRVANTFVR
jgi:NAD/NADP transhydrogenase beta subunit